MMQVRLATMNDIDVLLEIAKNFSGETRHKMEYCAETAHRTLTLYVSMSALDILICEDKTKITGAILVVSSLEFHKKPVGFITKLFVERTARDGHTSKRLMKAMFEWFEQKDVSHIFASATAGLSERDQKAFILLMKRSGFKESGPALYFERT